MVRIIKFVALGNSLTVGYIPMRLACQPYHRFLKEMVEGFLKRLKKSGLLDVRFMNRGVNGDLTSDMLGRFGRDVVNLKPDYVIILGGTNDIGWGSPVEEIFSNLARMYKEAEYHGIVPIGCTIPSVLGWDVGIPPRLKLNKLIKGFCLERGILCVDLFEWTSDPESKRLRPEYSSDGLHLNTLGYKKAAEAIFKDSIRILLTRELRWMRSPLA